MIFPFGSCGLGEWISGSRSYWLRPDLPAGLPAGEPGAPVCFLGETTESEKSMMYRTSLRQKMQGVSSTLAVTSDETLSGNVRKHSVHVSTMYGMPLASLPFRGTQTGADRLLCAMVCAAEVRSKFATSRNSVLGVLAPFA